MVCWWYKLVLGCTLVDLKKLLKCLTMKIGWGKTKAGSNLESRKEDSTQREEKRVEN